MYFRSMALVSAVLLGVACSPAQKSGSDDATLGVVVNAVQGGQQINVVETWIHLTGTNRFGPVDRWIQVTQFTTLPNGTDQYSASIRLPAGTYNVDAQAYMDVIAGIVPDPAGADAAILAFRSPTNAVALTRAGFQLGLLLQQVAPPDQYLNTAPVVNSLAASAFTADSFADGTLVPPVTPQVVNIAASVADPDAGDILSFQWTASPAVGAFGNAVAQNTTWTPPANATGETTLTLTVTDLRGAKASASILVRYQPNAGTGVLQVVISFNNAPDVTDIFLTDPVSGALVDMQLAPNEAVDVSVAAIDPDGDALGYAWTATCGGGAPVALGTTATVAFTAPATEQACVLAVTVTDARLGSNTSALTVNVKTATSAWAVEWVVADQTPINPVPFGVNVQFAVAAAQWNGTAYATLSPFGWTYVGGAATTPVTFLPTPGLDAPDGSSITFVPPACPAGPTQVTYTVTASVNDLADQPATFDFPVVVSCQ